MGNKKLQRFEAINHFPNVLQYPEGIAGRWKHFFKNDNDITLELACGRGEYTVGLSELYPKRNFVGVDIKGNRMYSGALYCLENHLSNAAFLRVQIDKIDRYFIAHEVSEIWITFPDPHLRTSRAKKRLTHPRFLRRYQSILKPGGVVHLKTDSPSLYHFTKLVVDLYDLSVEEQSEDLYARVQNPAELHIKTHYEKLDIADSKQVYYIRFRLPATPIGEPGLPLQLLLKKIETAEML
jgi:tRNA (guanine-N7-)-methyltransferase